MLDQQRLPTGDPSRQPSCQLGPGQKSSTGGVGEILGSRYVFLAHDEQMAFEQGRAVDEDGAVGP
jgi:hypothetical protein